MSLTITSLRTDYRVTEGWFNGEPTDCPYIIVNCCFRVEQEEENWSWLRAKSESEEYQRVLTIDDPERYENWLMGDGWNLETKYDGYGRAWTHHDCPWRYIEKFDTFHFREWIADCGPTRAIIQELEY